MTELKLGKMTKAELAEWFGITESSYSRQRAKKMELLEDYADFEEVYGGVVIKEIYQPVFMKKSGAALVRQMAEKAWNELNTVKNVSIIIGPKIVEQTGVKERSVYNSVSRWKVHNYGKYNGKYGVLGKCQPVWAQYIEEERRFRELEQAERNVIKKWAQEIFDEYNEQQLLLRESYLDKEIDKEEFEEAMSILRLSNSHLFEIFYDEVTKELGFKPVHATKLIRFVFPTEN